MKFLSQLANRFFVRTFISYVMIIGVVFLILYFFSQGTVRNFFIENLKTNLRQVGHSMMPKISDLYEKREFEKLNSWIKDLGTKINTRITVIASDGSVLADSEKEPEKMENHGDRPEVVQALKGNVRDATRFSTTMGEEMLYLALPMEVKGGSQLILRVSLYLNDINDLVARIKLRYATALLVLFILALLIAWYFSHGFSRPIKKIVTAFREFSSGDFDAKIFIKKKDELGEVAKSFNNMVDEQSSLFNKLNESREELQTIISSMREGLLVLSPDGKITLCNESFKNIIGKKMILGEFYGDLIGIAGFEEYVKTAFHEGESLNKEIELKNKTYLVGFDRLGHGEKLFIIFRDITEFKRLEQMKRDFVVNLTHELKTPLTAIKGFVETLEEEEDIKHTNYIEIIKRHTDRMNQIVTDLLILSELEEKSKRNFQFKPLDFSEIVENILKIYQEEIKGKKLKLDVDINQGLKSFKGEKFKIEQMFINLIDNAVKYTESGKVSILIKKVKSGKFIKIQVKNSSIPIPAERLPRLFERFYVVDKSRSRRLGGTGLGLSIVKHVILLHDGKISVTSNKKEGTVFTIILPLIP